MEEPFRGKTISYKTKLSRVSCYKICICISIPRYLANVWTQK